MRPAGTSTAWLYCANGARMVAGLIGAFHGSSVPKRDGRDKPGHDEVESGMPADFLSIPPSLTRFHLANARVPVCLVCRCRATEARCGWSRIRATS